MAGSPPGAAPGHQQLRSAPPFTPVYSFHDPFAWSTARLLQVRATAARQGGMCSRWAPRKPTLLCESAKPLLHAQVGALVGAWVAGSLALVLVIRLFLRAVRATRFTWLCVQGVRR
jgi:hypothetical protein